MGTASGDMKTALAAVEDGSDMSAKLQAQYMAAGMNRKDTADRQDDDDNASAADNASASDDNGDIADNVVSLVESKLGIKGE